MHKRILKYTLIIAIIIFVSASLFIKKYHNKPYIDKILTTKSYSYLPNEAKNYIKETYETTGQIILTEKNKKENTPYLNPDFISYLTLSEEEKATTEIIPETYIIDFSKDLIKNNQEKNYSSEYDISDLNDNNYTTQYYNQGNLEICWAFATVEQAESYLMIKNNAPYTSSTEKFSVRQLDYGTSTNGINNYLNENGYRELTSGGNYFMSSFLMSYGLSLVNESYMPFSETTEKKSLYNVLNYKNSNYELMQSKHMPILGDSYSEDEKNTYLNTIKDNIMAYGGAFVATGSPKGECGFKNTDGTYAIVDNNTCIQTSNSGHAMQIIGWKDDYEYEYCYTENKNYAVNANGTCSTGTKKTGKGAWILRNSWGTESKYKRVYLAYTPGKMSISFTTNLSSMNNKKWDNVYHKNIWQDNAASSSTDTIRYNKKINTKEKIELVKFFASGMNATYKVSIRTNNNEYNNIKTINVSLPGINTIDLSSNNIIIDSDSFDVTITGVNSSQILTNTISVYTSNVEKNVSIQTKNINIDDMISNSETSRKYAVYSDTKNIDSNETISYSLTKGNNNYDNYILSITDNIVAENNVNTILEISNSIPTGNYTLKISYGNYISTTILSILPSFSLSGSGTEDDPYLIGTEDELKQMVYNLSAYYKLTNDITLTDEWTPIGTEIDPFKGGFDGDNHTINNLIINSENNDSLGLFGYVKNEYYYKYLNSNLEIAYNNKKSYIKNVKINNPTIYGNGNTAVLIGTLLYDYNDKPSTATNIDNSSVNIDNISIINGKVTSTSNNSGFLIGNINITPYYDIKPYLYINNIFTSSTVNGFNSAGLIGYVNDSNISSSNMKISIEITNYENLGKIEIPNNKQYQINDLYSPVIGGLYGNANLNLENYIINTTIINNNMNNKDEFYIGNIEENSGNDFTISVSHGYYLSKYIGNNYTTDLNDIKNISNYSNWNNFNDYWQIPTIDSINRIPLLKNASITYTSCNDIIMNKYDEISLLEKIEGEKNKDYLIIQTDNSNEVINLINDTINDDVIIKAISKGTTTITIKSLYDGFEKVINVTVNSEKVDHPTIQYHKNDNSEEAPYSQTVNANESFNLLKNTYERLTYNFTGWNTREDGTGITYTDEALIEDGIDENLRLYAQWEEIEYKVIYNSNSGEGTMNDSLNFSLSNNNSYTLDKNEFTKDNYDFIGWNTKADGSGYSFSDKETININKVSYFTNNVLTLYAQWEESFKYKINTYSYDLNNHIIKEILPLTTVNEFKSKIELGSNCTIKIDSKTVNNKEVLYTGGKTKIYKNNQLLIEFTNVVTGDSNEDGKISSADLLSVRQHLLKIKVLKEAKLLAADSNKDGKVSSADLLSIRQHLLGIKIIK